MSENKGAPSLGNRIIIILHRLRFSITLEPLMFLYTVSVGLNEVIRSNLIFDKICYSKLGFNETVCQDLNNPLYDTLEKDVQLGVSDYETLYNSIAFAPRILYALLAGTWSDKHGRKILLGLPLLGQLLASLSYGLNYFLLTAQGAAWQLLFLEFVSELCGSYVAYYLAIYSFITDISTDENRTTRLSVCDGVDYISTAIGTLISGFVYSSAGYYGVFGCSAGSSLLSLLYLILFIKESLPRDSGRPTEATCLTNSGAVGINYGLTDTTAASTATRDITAASVADTDTTADSMADTDTMAHNTAHTDTTAASTATRDITAASTATRDTTAASVADTDTTAASTADTDTTAASVAVALEPNAVSSDNFMKEGLLFAVESLRTVFKRREGPRRKILFIGIFNFACYIFVFNGTEGTHRYSYAQQKYEWTEQEFTRYLFNYRIAYLVALWLVLPLLSRILKINDSWITIFCCITSIAGFLVPSLTSSDTWFTVGSFICMFTPLTTVTTRSVLSKVISPEEIGRVFSVLALLSASSGSLVEAAFQRIYSATLSTFPGCYLSVLAGLLAITLPTNLAIIRLRNRLIATRE